MSPILYPLLERTAAADLGLLLAAAGAALLASLLTRPAAASRR